ncbi:MAG: CPBP family intramembrane glutamic endopeptidase [Oscillospiraceae bacterium]|nr:CPBP family intramembrane glutamic endopeptidase [Oscillospiraceae bacterium]
MTEQKRPSNRNIGFILLVAVTCVALMAAFEIIWKPSYIIKAGVKIVLLLIIPLVVTFSFRCCSGVNKVAIGFMRALKPGIKTGIIAVTIGAAVYAFIIIAYLLLRNIIDLSRVTDALANGVGVGKDNFLYVSLYIAFVNSLIEEVFFRAFCFFGLKTLIPRRKAYLFSSVLFSVYHVSMLIGWFSIPIFAAVLIALVAAGVIFIGIDEAFNSVFASWATHCFSNLAVNTIGLVLLKII